MVDSFSRWLQMNIVHSTNPQETITKLQNICNYVGYPEVIVTDNGPSFTSLNFRI